jgi:hypothetical protein
MIHIFSKKSISIYLSYAYIDLKRFMLRILL